MFKKLVSLLVLLISVTAFAHEGHEAPVSLKPNHGGVVKGGRIINLEYVVLNDEVTFYPTTHDGKALTATDVKLTATAKLPKGKAQPVPLEIKNDVFTTKVDFKDSYRVEYVVSADLGGKVSSFKIQVEKQ